MTDSERLDCLERWANQPGGLLLHDGSETGRLGIGLRPGSLVRTLRQAIDQVAEHEYVMANAPVSEAVPDNGDCGQ